MLLLDEKEYKSLSDTKKVLHLLQWLQNLPEAIKAAERAELKSKQKALTAQLQPLLHETLGPPLRQSLGQAFVSLYEAGESFSMHDTIGKCCDVLRGKEESSSTTTNKLCALEVLGNIYEHQGRMAGSAFPETVQVLLKLWKVQEYRSDIMNVLTRLLKGLGPSSSSAHKDIHKCVKNGLGDKSMAVRSAAAKCALELAQYSTFLYTSEFDSFSNSCLRSLDGSSYSVRCSVAKLLGSLLSRSQKPLPRNMKGKLKLPSLDEALGILSNGFVRGGSGFLKSGGPDLLKSGTASRECRVGVTQAYVIFLTEMGGGWVERHLPVVTQHILSLLSHSKVTSTHIDAVYSRKCVSFILRSVFGQLLGESAQYVAAKHLCQLIIQTTSTGGGGVGGGASAPQGSRGQRSEGMLERVDSEEGGMGGEREGGGRDRASSQAQQLQQQQQHSIICAILEVGALVFNLNTAALPLVVSDSASSSSGGVAMGGVSSKEQQDQQQQPPLFAALNKILQLPQLAARVAGAWCLHCVGLALPSQLTNLVTHCLMQLRDSKRQTQAGVSGYCYAVSALLGTVRNSELGLPSAKAKEVLAMGRDFVERGVSLKDAASEKMAQMYINGGWALIGAFISLGSVHVKAHLRPLLTLWRGSFPHSVREMNKELSEGTLSSWMVVLDNRAGALAAIGTFVKFCSDLLTPELIRRLMLPLDSALAQIAGLGRLVKVHGVQIKAGGATLRLRLFQALEMLPPNAYEGSLSSLLKELVTEFTLADTLATTTTSLLRSMCHRDDCILLGSWLEETDHQSVEEQLQTNSAAGSGALEHDPNSIYMSVSVEAGGGGGTTTPDPLPLGVSVIDSAILLFGKAFPSVATKHRQQLLSHFKDCITQAKSARQQSIQINIFTAFLAALKNLVDSKSVLGQQEILNSAYALIARALVSAEPMLRCAAGEAMGRMSQVGGDSTFVARIAQTSFDHLKNHRDPVTRTGHSLVLGCLHRYVGGMGSGQHLQMSVSVLHQLTQDASSTIVQVWALHALALITDSGGPMFRNYVESTLTVVLHLLVTTPPSLVEVHQCLAKCLSSLITTLGPELQDTSRSMKVVRQTCLTCCSIVQEHPDAIVQSAAIGCLQQLQLFAPQYVSLPVIVPRLRANLDSSHLLLRRAAANCLRQFTQREPKIVWTLAAKAPKSSESGGTERGISTPQNQKGLEYVVLMKLDVESDAKLCEDLREILFSLLTSLAPDDPMKWLHLCNGVLSATGGRGGKGGMSGGGAGSEVGGGGGGGEEGGGADDDEDAAKFATGAESEESQLATKIAPRWPSKVFAVECSRKIYAVCRKDPAHLHPTLAAKKKAEKGGDYLVMHLNELVRTSFISATASVDQLKLAGYEALRDVINLFASTPDPDFPGHLLLEQYQAQIGAALRPAFSSDSAPHVTAMACQVCSEWLGSGVSRDLGDLKRVQQLLVSSLEKVRRRRQEEMSVYGESVATMEALAVLKAWAELYIKVSEDLSSTGGGTGGGGGGGAAAVELTDPHLPVLSQFWLAALRDKAYLFLPAEFGSQLPPAGGTFYSVDVMDAVKPYYDSNWSSLLHAAAIWLQERGFQEMKEKKVVKSTSSGLPPPLLSSSSSSNSPPPIVPNADPRVDSFHLILGLSVQCLCSPATLDQPLVLANCLRALGRLLKEGASTPPSSSSSSQEESVVRNVLSSDARISVEILSMLHRLLLTCQATPTHILALQTALQLGAILREIASTATPISPPEPKPDDKEGLDGTDDVAISKLPVAMETAVEPGVNSCVYALLEVVSSCLLRLIPSLQATTSQQHSQRKISPTPSQPHPKRDELICMLLSSKILVCACGMCLPEALPTVLPPVLHMLLSTLGYASSMPTSATPTSQGAVSDLLSGSLQSLSQLCNALPLSHEGVGPRLVEILQSALMSVLGKYVRSSSGKGSEGGELEMNNETRLVVVAVLLHVPAPPSHRVCPAPSNLFDGCVSLLEGCLNTGNTKLQVKALHTCKSLFSSHASNPTSVHFIHRLGPEVVKLVERCGLQREGSLEVMTESSQVLELLLEATPTAKKSQMMALLIPLYISILVNPSTSDLRTLPKARRQIHDFFLQRVTLIGPKYPEAFRSVMQASPALKQKLELAVRANQSSASTAGGRAVPTPGVGAGRGATTQQQPSIKLKMDFKNFK